MKYFHGKNKKQSYFEGWYFKQTNSEELLAFIPSIHIDQSGNKKALIQIISTDGSYQVEFSSKDTYISRDTLYIRIGGNEFSKQGLKVNINMQAINLEKNTKEPLQCSGKLYYTHITALESDIMGPFRFVPFMECNHGVISVRHKVTGSIFLNGKEFTFYDNMGYMEMDWGTSFPEKYFWLQCNDFKRQASIMLSIAEIPFLSTKFTGCICSVYLNEKEYRLATYKKVKILKLSKSEVILRQGDYLFKIALKPSKEHTLLAPDKGDMIRKVKETIKGTADFKFQIGDKTIFEETSHQVSYEWVNYESESGQL